MVVSADGARPELRIRCTPVRFEAVDPNGTPVPVAIRLTREGKSLLRKEARVQSAGALAPLGGQYDSSFGRFTLSAEGRIDAKGSQLAPGVAITASGLRGTVDSAGEIGPAAEPATDVVTVTASRGAKEPFPRFAMFSPLLVGLDAARSASPYRRSNSVPRRATISHPRS